MRLLVLGLCLFSTSPALAAGTTAQAPPTPVAIAMPGGEAGIGFDDLAYSTRLGKLLVPAGRTGMIDLVDLETGSVVSIPGFTARADFPGGHEDGVTSVVEGEGLLFATDRTALQLSIVDPATKAIVGHTALSASPDYVRWLAAAREIWVSEPDSQRIEIFRLTTDKPPRLEAVTKITLPGDPESLVLDVRRRRAYTNLESKTVAIDLRTRAIVATWKNGCEGASGLALDAKRGLLFVACEAGGLTAVDVTTGKQLSKIALAGGIDIIAYDPDLGHVYVPSAETKTLAMVGVSLQGALSLLGTFPATEDSHCIAVRGKVYFGDPEHGRLLAVTDPYTASLH